MARSGRNPRLPSTDHLVGWALAALGGAGLALHGNPLVAIAGLAALVASGVVLFRLPPDAPEQKERGVALEEGSDLLAQLQEGVVLLGPARQVKQFNAAAQHLLGRSSRLEEGAALEEILREPESLQQLESAFGGLVVEWTLRREPRVLRMRALPLEQEGTQVGVLVTLDDVTRLEALETTRQKFISNASHELKTPVTSIRIAAEGLLDAGVGGEEAKAPLESVLRSVTKLAMLLDDISELSRIETGALRLDRVELDLGSFLEGLRQDLEPGSRARRLLLEAAPDLAGLRFRADGARLHQMLDNLVANALKFSPPGSQVVLRIGRDGNWLRWDVVDQGPGIATGDLKRIFERFYRSPAVRGVPGTGLGLAIVKHLAFQMGGEVSVESELGVGSTFTLRLPL